MGGLVENACSKSAAINALQNFIHAVELQRGVEIPDADPNALITAAQACLAIRNRADSSRFPSLRRLKLLE